MCKKVLIVFVFLLIFTTNIFGQSIILESVDGLLPGGEIPINESVTFNIKMTAGGTGHIGITNGFRVYSPDGASWTTTVADTANLGWEEMFPLIFAINEFSTDGSGADTVGFGGSGLFSGLPGSFDQVAYYITIGPIPSSSQGGTIVLDSSFYAPTGVWKWAGPEAYPSWDGPHVFMIEGVDPPPYTLEVTPDTFFFSMLINDTSSQEGTFSVSQTATSDPIDFTASETAPFINLFSSGGTTPEDILFEVVNHNSTAGIYVDSIEVASSSAINSPQFVTVVLELVDPLKYLVVDPTVLNFTALEGHANPETQEVMISEVNNFNIEFEAHNNDDWIYLIDSVGTTPATVSVGVEISGLAPGFYQDTVYYNYDEDPQDGSVFLTLIHLEVTPNSTPQVTPINDFYMDECGLISSTFTATDTDGDDLLLSLDPLSDNMSFQDNGNGAGLFNFDPDLTQAGNYVLTFSATDGIDTTSTTFNIIVDECEIQLTAKAVVVPDMLYAFFLNAIEPMTGVMYFGDFVDGHSADDVGLETITINSSIVPLSASIVDPWPQHEFISNYVVKLEFNMNDFLNPYVPFFDTTVEFFSVIGNFNDSIPFEIQDEVILRGHLSGDFNLDGIVDISDLVAMAAFFFHDATAAPLYLESLDFNHDQMVDITDLVLLAQYIFSQ